MGSFHPSKPGFGWLKRTEPWKTVQNFGTFQDLILNKWLITVHKQLQMMIVKYFKSIKTDMQQLLGTVITSETFLNF